jgi:hypothetical protein
MDRHEESDCIDVLLDLVCYEILSKRVSPEMEHLLERHVRGCASCRRKVLGFRRILRGEPACPNFG